MRVLCFRHGRVVRSVLKPRAALSQARLVLAGGLRAVSQVRRVRMRVVAVGHERVGRRMEFHAYSRVNRVRIS